MKAKNYDNIIIDMSNFYHRAYSVGSRTIQKLTDGTQVSTGAIVETFAMLDRLLNNFSHNDTTIFVVFEGGKSSKSDRVQNKRQEIDPEYKSNRKHKDVVFYRGLEMVELMLLHSSETTS